MKMGLHLDKIRDVKLETSDYMGEISFCLTKYKGIRFELRFNKKREIIARGWKVEGDDCNLSERQKKYLMYYLQNDKELLRFFQEKYPTTRLELLFFFS